jgi:ubiquinone/menaquinone biosynthesis C-methylase UbiE
VDINESLLLSPITTELVDNDLLIKPDKDESLDALIIGNTIHIIPRDKTTILDFILRVPRAVGVIGVIINKKDELENPPSRSRIPKIKRSRSK